MAEFELDGELDVTLSGGAARALERQLESAVNPTFSSEAGATSPAQRAVSGGGGGGGRQRQRARREHRWARERTDTLSDIHEAILDLDGDGGGGLGGAAAGGIGVGTGLALGGKAALAGGGLLAGGAAATMQWDGMTESPLGMGMIEGVDQADGLGEAYGAVVGEFDFQQILVDQLTPGDIFAPLWNEAIDRGIDYARDRFGDFSPDLPIFEELPDIDEILTRPSWLENFPPDVSPSDTFPQPPWLEDFPPDIDPLELFPTPPWLDTLESIAGGVTGDGSILGGRTATGEDRSGIVDQSIDPTAPSTGRDPPAPSANVGSGGAAPSFDTDVSIGDNNITAELPFDQILDEVERREEDARREIDQLRREFERFRQRMQRA